MNTALRLLRGTGEFHVFGEHDGGQTHAPLSILMLLGGLGVGGAETQAVALGGALQQRGHRITIVSLNDGPLRGAVESLGLPLEVLSRSRAFSPTAIPALVRLMRRCSPDVVYAFLDVQWLLAIAARSVAPGPRVVLGLRSSQYFQSARGLRERAVQLLARRVGRYADLLIANSESGLRDFVRSVPQAPDGLVIPNGIDHTRFNPDPAGRRAIRAAWSVTPDQLLIGHVGRLDPVKNHEKLIDAFARVASTDSRVMLACVGDGSPARLAALRACAAHHGVTDRVIFAGGHSDLSPVYSAFDVLALCSLREGFPNVVAEAMLCGVPAAVTDTGASAAIVGALGEVAPNGDTEAFAISLRRLLARRSTALSARCRLHILADFTLERCTTLTSAALQTLIPTPRDP